MAQFDDSDEDNLSLSKQKPSSGAHVHHASDSKLNRKQKRKLRTQIEDSMDGQGESGERDGGKQSSQHETTNTKKRKAEDNEVRVNSSKKSTFYTS
jgi:hypothetical protein